jgi:hypothetical protein
MERVFLRHNLTNMKSVIKNISFFGILLVIGCAIFISQNKYRNISGKVPFSSYVTFK